MTSYQFVASGPRELATGNETAKFCVLGLVHHADRASARLLDDAIVRDDLTHERSRGRQSPAILWLRREASQGIC